VTDAEVQRTICSAEYFDGASAASSRTRVQLSGEWLIIGDPPGAIDSVRWPVADTRWISGKDKPVLTLTDTPDARLVLDLPELALEISARNPAFREKIKTEKSRKTHALAWKFGLAAIVLSAGLLVAVPWLSRPLALVASDAWRDGMGKKSAAGIEKLLGKRCDDIRGERALANLAERLSAALPTPEKIQVGVLDTDMVNAFALSGGHIRIMRGLITEAADADEVAGVLAHEIAHVALRHPEELMFRQMGYQILLSTIADSGMVTEATATVGLHLVNSAYSRGAETAADALALRLLRRANISSQGFEAFFARLDAAQGSVESAFKYVSSHPPSGQRKQLIEQNGNDGETAMPAADWAALKLVCANN